MKKSSCSSELASAKKLVVQPESCRSEMLKYLHLFIAVFTGQQDRQVQKNVMKVAGPEGFLLVYDRLYCEHW